MKVTLAAVTVTASLAFTAVAEAHTLRLSRAQNVVDTVAARVAQDYAEDGRYDRVDYGTDPCERRTRHRAICDFAWSFRVKETDDRYVCSARLGVRLKDRRSRELVVKVLRRKCEKVA